MLKFRALKIVVYLRDKPTNAHCKYVQSDIIFVNMLLALL